MKRVVSRHHWAFLAQATGYRPMISTALLFDMFLVERRRWWACFGYTGSLCAKRT